jgi:two-component system NtrC family sensor kinase
MRFNRAFMVLSLVALATIVALASWYDRALALRAAEDHVELTVDVMREHSLKVFGMLELVLDQIRLRTAGLDRETISRSDEIASFLRETRDRMNPISSIDLTDPTGHVLASSQSPPPPSLTYEDRSDFQALRENDPGTLVGEPRLGTFELTRRRSTSTGEFDGVISIAISAAYFENFFRGLDELYRHRALLVRTDGTVLASNSSGDEPPKFSPISELMRSIADRVQSDKWTPSPAGFVHFFRWRALPPYPVYVAYAIDQDVALSTWYMHVVFYAVLGAAAWAALCCIVFLASRRAIAEAALERAQRMEAIGQLASGVAHDFNNLLTTVIGNLDLIAHDEHATRRIRQLAAGALRGALRGESLTTQLLAFARRQPLRPSVVRVDEVLDAMLPMIEDAVGETISVSCRLRPDLSAIQVDPGQLEAALLNLALNARDAMPRGGTLLIEARNAAVDRGEAAGRAIPPGAYVVIEIADNGVGMRTDVAARAFEPFFTTKEIGKGTGLGLSMVYGFARQSGGAVEIVSRADVGTTIKLYLPRSKQAPQSEQLPSAAPPLATRKAVLLVVEDQEEVRQLVADSLEGRGHEVKTARDATEAIDLLSRDTHIQVLLTDVILPGGMTGMDLARKARELTPELKILVISGNAAEEAIQASGLERYTFLPKPFRLSDLNRAVDELLEPTVNPVGPM